MSNKPQCPIYRQLKICKKGIQCDLEHDYNDNSNFDIKICLNVIMGEIHLLNLKVDAHILNKSQSISGKDISEKGIGMLSSKINKLTEEVKDIKTAIKSQGIPLKIGLTQFEGNPKLSTDPIRRRTTLHDRSKKVHQKFFVDSQHFSSSGTSIEDNTLSNSPTKSLKNYQTTFNSNNEISDTGFPSPSHSDISKTSQESVKIIPDNDLGMDYHTVKVEEEAAFDPKDGSPILVEMTLGNYSEQKNKKPILRSPKVDKKEMSRSRSEIKLTRDDPIISERARSRSLSDQIKRVFLLGK